MSGRGLRCIAQVTVAATLPLLIACDNRNPPLPCPTPSQTVDIGQSVTFVPCFSDPDGDPLTLGAAVTAPSLATVSVEGPEVTVHGLQAGDLFVVATATDPDGLSAVQEVRVTVEGPLADVVIPEASPDSQTVAQGGVASFTFRARNQGDADAGATFFVLRVSGDSVITPSDRVRQMHSFRLPAFPPQDSAVLHLEVRDWPEPLGAAYFGLCADPALPESNALNNCSRGLRVTTTPAAAQGRLQPVDPERPLQKSDSNASSGVIAGIGDRLKSRAFLVTTKRAPQARAAATCIASSKSSIPKPAAKPIASVPQSATSTNRISSVMKSRASEPPRAGVTR